MYFMNVVKPSMYAFQIKTSNCEIEEYQTTREMRINFLLVTHVLKVHSMMK